MKVFAYLCYRGCTESRDKKLAGGSDVENYIYKKEGLLGLSKVNYEQFQGAVKRFGYKVNLSDEHLKAVSKQMNLDLEAMFNDPNSIQSTYYANSEYTFKDDRYQVQPLLKIGFLLCEHYSEDT